MGGDLGKPDNRAAPEDGHLLPQAAAREAKRSRRNNNPITKASLLLHADGKSEKTMIELGQTVHHSDTDCVGLVIGLGNFLIGGSRALVQRSFGPAGCDVTLEWIELERLAPLGRAVLEPYCEIPPRSPPRNTIAYIDDGTVSGGRSS
jgi:hypothetical protein